MKKLLLFSLIFVITSSAYSGVKINGSWTAGFFGGTPFWTQESYENGSLEPNSDYYRMYNSLMFGLETGDFSVNINANRSDHFSYNEDEGLFLANDHMNKNNIYQAYAQYKFDGGLVKAGRILPMTRWYYGSVDGAGIKYRLNDKLSFNAYGGLDVEYGELWDESDRDVMAYGEAMYSLGKYNGKAKVLYADSSVKAGLDLFASYGAWRFSGNMGYDFTNERLFDGMIAAYGYINPQLSISANISRITPINWDYKLINDEYIDRVLVGAAYKLNKDLSLNFRQLVSVNEYNTEYVSYLYANYSYFFAGINYLGSSRDNSRFGVSVGANYSAMDNLKFSLGIAAVDNLYTEIFKENQQSYSSYLKVIYDPLKYIALSGYINYYHNNRALNKDLRGGITIQYKFNGGSK